MMTLNSRLLHEYPEKRDTARVAFDIFMENRQRAAAAGYQQHLGTASYLDGVLSGLGQAAAAFPHSFIGAEIPGGITLTGPEAKRERTSFWWYLRFINYTIERLFFWK